MSAARVAAEKAVVLFQHFGWTWGGYGGREFIPTVDDIEAEYEFLADSLSGPGSSSSTGRLTVTAADPNRGSGDCYYLDLAETNPYDGTVLE